MKHEHTKKHESKEGYHKMPNGSLMKGKKHKDKMVKGFKSLLSM